MSKQKEHVPAKNDLRRMLDFSVTTYRMPSDKDIEDLEDKWDARREAILKKDKIYQGLAKEIRRKKSLQQSKLKRIIKTQRSLRLELAVEGPSIALGRKISKLVDSYHEFRNTEF